MSSQHLSRKERFLQELATLAFITRGGNWLFLLMSRLAEMLMFLSVLYVIAETVVPEVFKAAPVCHAIQQRMLCQPAQEIPLFAMLSSVCIIILNTAPEVILPGCFMQARTADSHQQWMYRAMGVVFIGLTFVTLASFIWGFSAGVVAVILFFRCAAGVLYSLLVRISPQPFMQSPRLQQTQLEELAASLQKSFNQQIQLLTNGLAAVEKNVHNRLNESSTMQADLHRQLANELAAVKENLQTVLANLPALQAQQYTLQGELQAQIQHIASSTSEELQRVRTSGTRQERKQLEAHQKPIERPALRALPAVQGNTSQARARRVKDTRQPAPQAEMGEKWDARAFVFACLENQAALKLTEIKHLARAEQQELSEATISRYRKQFFTNRESSSVVDNESATLQAESADESCLGESERRAAGQ